MRRIVVPGQHRENKIHKVPSQQEKLGLGCVPLIPAAGRSMNSRTAVQVRSETLSPK
jgi:hypothetical protein